MTTIADLVREMIHESTTNIRGEGGSLIHNNSERMEALWMEVDAHLKFADLCEVLGDYNQMTHHLDTIYRLLAKISNELPDQ